MGSSGDGFGPVLLAQTVTSDLQSVSIVNDPVEDGVGQGRLANQVVPARGTAPLRPHRERLRRSAYEQPAVRHASIPCGRTGHSAQIIVSILGQAARTEQQSVTDGSIETLVCTRDAPWRFARIAALSDAPIDPPSQPSFGPQSARAKKASARIQ